MPYCTQSILHIHPSIRNWLNTLLGTASTHTMMSPTFVRTHPSGSSKRVSSVRQQDPVAVFAKKHYCVRDRVLEVFAGYFLDEKNRLEGMPMIWEREVDLRAKGSTQSLACYAALFRSGALLALCRNTRNHIYNVCAFSAHLIIIP